MAGAAAHGSETPGGVQLADGAATDRPLGMPATTAATLLQHFTQTKVIHSCNHLICCDEAVRCWKV